MKRIFGRKAPKKEEPPPPSISEVSGRVDGRLGTLNEKINKLDRQLVVCIIYFIVFKYFF